ncbi:hypothetical protein SDC9_163464 [bioreactor metagenome]|uniref:Uncharacterized protein n=1 Tax=bioreactor metagenome TaxID=1076179 RepID=A0A645FQZ0_9ZZZZ
MGHDAGARDADVDDTLGLALTVKGAGHKGVVLYGVGKYDKLCAAKTVGVGRCRRSLFDDFTHAAHRVHVDAGPRRRHIDGGTDKVG